MSDHLEKAGLPKELPQTQVLSKLATDPYAEELHARLEELFEGGSLKVYRKDKNLLTLIDFAKKQRNSFPLVDKSTRMVFVVAGGNHVETMACLYYFIKSKQTKQKVTWSNMGRDIDEAADKYVEEGLGYYFSAAWKGDLYYRGGFHLVYGGDYKQDRNDEAVFETFQAGSQMASLPSAIRKPSPEMRKAMDEAEIRLAEYLKKEEDKS